jgi:thioredoxin
MKLSDFQHTIQNSSSPVLVDLWAPWCAPCRMTKPILEKLSMEYEGRIKFLTVNADESPEIARHYRVLAIPTVLAFEGGELTNRITGAQNEANYRRVFEAALLGEPMQLALSTFDRLLRLGAGLALIGVAFLTSNWVLALAGGALAFLGIYDRCPMVQALSKAFADRRTSG